MKLADFKFENIGSTISDADLSAFEQEIGGVIDTNLKQFLLMVNGGLPWPELRSNLPQLEHPINLFLGLESGYARLRRAYRELEESFDEFAPSQPKLVPFAFDYGDGGICVVRGKDESEIVYVPATRSLRDGDIDIEVIVVAADFEIFEASLFQEE